MEKKSSALTTPVKKQTFLLGAECLLSLGGAVVAQQHGQAWVPHEQHSEFTPGQI